MKSERVKQVALQLIIAAVVSINLTAQKSINRDNQTWSGPVTKWPRTIPARINDTENRDLFIMTLGEVTTPIAQGTFDPILDRITKSDGTVIDHYYRDSLGIKFYSPMSKEIFPLPPSGMCTWYYYYQHVTDKEVKLNTDWIAENLKPYGARYVQIDDGWQKETATGRKGSRDWTGFDKSFPEGMTSLAGYIKSKGLVPGIWIAPHGQSNEEVVKNNPGVFMLKPDGTSPSKTWEGDWLLDPTSDAGKKYFHNLFETMVGWGYDYFKIDGQPIVVEEYGKNSQYMAIKGGAADSLYRVSLGIIRSAIGDGRYLLGCWGLPLEGAGFMNGTRTGGDVVLGWDGFFTALDPTMASYFMHNIVWYTDPDVMLLRQPLTIDQARAWATLQGLTGQALMSSDRLPDLSDERVDILKKVFPAVDIRPLDLFPSSSRKRIWDLKVNHLGRSYDVTGLFNFDESKSAQLYLNWKELGLPADSPVHVFDFWNGEYLGDWEAGIASDVSPTSVRVLTLLPDNGRIQLISTSRHITQGWVDLKSLNANADGTIINGTSALPAGEKYKMYFVYPLGKYFRTKNVVVREGKRTIQAATVDHQGWAEVSFTVPVTGDISWEVGFEPDYSFSYAVRQPDGISVTSEGIDAVRIKWNSQYYLNAGYQIYLNDTLAGYTASTSFILRNLDPRKEYFADVRTVWTDGTVNKRNDKDGGKYIVKFTPVSLINEELPLSDLVYDGSPEWFTWPVVVGGKHYSNSFGMIPGSVRSYNVKGVFETLKGMVAVDDNTWRK